MSFFDLLWNIDQDKKVADLRRQIERLDQAGLATAQTDRTLRDLAVENEELKIRLALLIRLLISKGLVTAQEYAALLAEAGPADKSSGH